MKETSRGYWWNIIFFFYLINIILKFSRIIKSSEFSIFQDNREMKPKTTFVSYFFQALSDTVIFGLHSGQDFVWKGLYQTSWSQSFQNLCIKCYVNIIHIKIKFGTDSTFKFQIRGLKLSHSTYYTWRKFNTNLERNSWAS